MAENETQGRTLPEGFTLATLETSAGGIKYTVDVPQAESLDAVRAAYEAEGKNPDEVLLALWNAGNAQGGRQNGKQPVRDAIEEHGEDSPEVQAAIEEQRENARTFLQGAPRGGGGARHESGLTKKQRDALGTAVATRMARKGGLLSQKDMQEIAEELGIDPALMA